LFNRVGVYCFNCIYNIRTNLDLTLFFDKLDFDPIWKTEVSDYFIPLAHLFNFVHKNCFWTCKKLTCLINFNFIRIYSYNKELIKKSSDFYIFWFRVVYLFKVILLHGMFLLNNRLWWCLIKLNNSSFELKYFKLTKLQI
jgi:hypothetical protein